MMSPCRLYTFAFACALACAGVSGCGSSSHESVPIPEPTLTPIAGRSVLPAPETAMTLPAPPNPCGPPPVTNALLPAHRIVAFYGNPLSRRMGILGAVPPDSMLDLLEAQAIEYAEADRCTHVLTALHLVVVVAQPAGGADSKFRVRALDSLVERVAQWAEQRDALLFLDVQPGRSSLQSEIDHLEPYLARPYVHLAIDPEFDMNEDQVPGKIIGSTDAADINAVIDRLAAIVTAKDVPPKLLVVHRFTQGMIRNADQIRLDPRVQVVIDMDGFGAPWLKRESYDAYVGGQIVQYTGFKLFYQLDKPFMSAAEVLALNPAPLFILYQ
jgi:hypothetical protein